VGGITIKKVRLCTRYYLPIFLYNKNEYDVWVHYIFKIIDRNILNYEVIKKNTEATKIKNRFLFYLPISPSYLL